MTGGEGPNHAQPAAPGKPAGVNPRERVIDAALKLASQREFADVTLTDIAHEAGLSLADFRDLFPSKGAVIGGLFRRIDREVLNGFDAGSSADPARERLFAVLERRLKALEPYREALASVARWASADPLMAAALNREAVNSLRFMLEAADIDSDGPVGALKLQGLAFAWRRVLEAWFEHGDMGDALEALDRELSKGERYVERAEGVARWTRPFQDMAARLFDRGVGRRRRDAEDDYPHPHA